MDDIAAYSWWPMQVQYLDRVWWRVARRATERWAELPTRWRCFLSPYLRLGTSSSSKTDHEPKTCAPPPAHHARKAA